MWLLRCTLFGCQSSSPERGLRSLHTTCPFWSLILSIMLSKLSSFMAVYSLYFAIFTFFLSLAFNGYLLVGVGVRSVDSSHSSVYFLKIRREWESHSVGPTHFWSGEWEWDSHWERSEWIPTPTSPIFTLLFFNLI